MRQLQYPPANDFNSRTPCLKMQTCQCKLNLIFYSLNRVSTAPGTSVNTGNLEFNWCC